MGSTRNRPKTPTAGAWWALMDDDDVVPADEKKHQQVHVQSPTTESSQWGVTSSLWSAMSATVESAVKEADVPDRYTPSVKSSTCSEDDGDIDAIEQKRRSPGDAKNQKKVRITVQTKEKKKHASLSRTQRPADHQQKRLEIQDMKELLARLQCGGTPKTLDVLEDKFMQHIEGRMDETQLCKSFLQSEPVELSFSGTTVTEDEDSGILERPTESTAAESKHFLSEEESSGEESKTQSSAADETFYEEFQDEIPFLKERNELRTLASTKYKEILTGSYTTEPATTPKETKIENKQTCKPPLDYSDDEEAMIPNPWNGYERQSNSSQREHLQQIVSEKDGMETTIMIPAFYALRNSYNNNERQMPPTAAAENKGETSNFMSDGEQENGLPTVNIVALAAQDQLLSGMSPLTPDTAAMSAIQQHLPYKPKTCMPPLLMKNFGKIKNSISLSKSVSTSSDSKNWRKGGNKTVKSILAEYADEEVGAEYTYDFWSRTHSYVAFFRRGTPASQSVRLYEHPAPSEFPTLDSEVVVQIEASTVSTTDCAVRRGECWGEESGGALNLPIIPGVAFAGVIQDTGDDGSRTGLRQGDRVVSLVRVGANSRHICISSDRLVRVPNELQDACALACIPEIYLTSFQALHIGQKNAARYRKTSLAGKSVLIVGGATVLGRALIEVAVAAGCTSVYATGKEKQFDSIQKAGGLPLGRNPRQWCSILAGKIDVVVAADEPGGNLELKPEHIQSVAKNGKIILLRGPKNDLNPTKKAPEIVDELEEGRKIHYYNVFDSWDNDLKQAKRDLTHLLKLLGDGLIKPRILERIPLKRVSKAQDLMEHKKLNGFILCEPWMTGRKKETSGLGLLDSLMDDGTPDTKTECSSKPSPGTDYLKRLPPSGMNHLTATNREDIFSPRRREYSKDRPPKELSSRSSSSTSIKIVI